MKRNIFATSGLIVTSFFAAVQNPASAQETSMNAQEVSNVRGGALEITNTPHPDAALIDVQDQVVPDGKLFVRQVDAPNIGWLVVRESIGGKPGAILGYVTLHPGGNTNVIVPLRALPSSGMAIVSVHCPPRSSRTLSSFNMLTYPLAKGGNKSAISTIRILPSNTTQVATPSL
jgi:hypothetical protein